MKALQKTLFVIGLLFLSVQTFRHVYVKIFNSQISVLDKYNYNVDINIEQSKNIEELLALYDKAYKEVKEYEKNHSKEEISNNYNQEPHKTEQRIKNAIQEWENHNDTISKLRFYWFCGLLSILSGFIVYIKIEQWIGIVGIITGFSEMIYWTSPTFIGFFGSRISEFEHLLNNKLSFAVISWLLLIITWFLLQKYPGKNK